MENRVIIALVYLVASAAFLWLAIPPKDATQAEMAQSLPYFVGWGLVSVSLAIVTS